MYRSVQGYACGFLFDADLRHVLLIRKRRPAWQAGRLNGVGGKIEPGETPIEAMQREFREEAALDVSDWREGVVLTGPDWCGHFFLAIGDVTLARAVTDEQLEIHPIAPLPPDVIPNLRWIIPLLLDDDVATGKYSVTPRGHGGEWQT